MMTRHGAAWAALVAITVCACAPVAGAMSPQLAPDIKLPPGTTVPPAVTAAAKQAAEQAARRAAHAEAESDKHKASTAARHIASASGVDTLSAKWKRAEARAKDGHFDISRRLLALIAGCVWLWAAHRPKLRRLRRMLM